MEIENLLKLINEVSKSGLTEFKYEENGVKVSLKTQKEIREVVTMQSPVTGAIPMEAKVATEVPVIIPGVTTSGVTTTGVTTSDVTTSDLATSDAHVVKAPLVGTFYEASSEGAKPFVQVGDVVKKGQVLGIIEAMKLMNEIECETDGTVEEVLVKNQEMVEYGQPLFRIV